jgi:hypothetical protein
LTIVHWREKVRAEPCFVDRQQKAWLLLATPAQAPTSRLRYYDDIIAITPATGCPAQI